jgi:mannose-6-phosphate isomerase-like protein (cupin superfamily)
MSGPAEPRFDAHAVLVHLRDDGRAERVTWTPDAFRRLVTGKRDRVVGAKRGVAPADFHADEWEVHPAGDEVLYLLAGDLDVVLDEPGGERTVRLRGGEGCLVPQGVWHRLVLGRPSDLLFITPARGTRHRPVDGTTRRPRTARKPRRPARG